METKKEIKEEIESENLFQDLPLNGYFCHLCTTKFEDFSMLKVHSFFASYILLILNRPALYPISE